MGKRVIKQRDQKREILVQGGDHETVTQTVSQTRTENNTKVLYGCLAWSPTTQHSGSTDMNILLMQEPFKCLPPKSSLVKQPGHSSCQILLEANQKSHLPTNHETDASLPSLPGSLYLRCFLPVPRFLSSQKVTEGCHMLRGAACSPELRSHRSLHNESVVLPCLHFITSTIFFKQQETGTGSQ